MARERHHIDEIAHLGAGAVLPAIDGNREIDARKFRSQPLHEFQGRVGRIAHPEDYLKLRIDLIAERAQTLIRFLIGAAQGLQNRHGWRVSPYTHCDASYDAVDHGECGQRDPAPHETRVSDRVHSSGPGY
jgi:hypothetical protein